MDAPVTTPRSRRGRAPHVDAAGLAEMLGPWSAGPGPLVGQLEAALTATIERGDLRPGDRLPPERALGVALAVSRTTVVAALDGIRSRGLVQRRQGSGTWVTPVAALGSEEPDRGGRSSLGPGATPLERVRPVAREIDLVGHNPIVQGMLASPSGTIQLTAATLPGTPAVLAATLAAATDDLPALVSRHGYMPYGLPALRSAIADRLNASGVPTSPGQILVTSGALQAISILATAFLGTDVPVIVEDPTFPVALDVFRAVGAEPVGLHVGRGHIDPGELGALLRRWRPGLAYLIPTHQNPTGTTLAEPARRSVAALAADLGMLVVEDLALEGIDIGSGRAPRPIASHAPDGPIITVGSLSKRCWAGLRIGWIRAPETTIARLGRIKVVADYGTSIVSQAVAVHLFEHLDEIERERRTEITADWSIFRELLATHLPDWSVETPTGGISAWTRIPDGDASAFAQVALRHGVAIVPGPITSASGRHADRVRLPFGSPDALRAGLPRLAEAWAAYRPDRAEPPDSFNPIV